MKATKMNGRTSKVKAIALVVICAVLAATMFLWGAAVSAFASDNAAPNEATISQVMDSAVEKIAAHAQGEDVAADDAVSVALKGLDEVSAQANS